MGEDLKQLARRRVLEDILGAVSRSLFPPPSASAHGGPGSDPGDGEGAGGASGAPYCVLVLDEVTTPIVSGATSVSEVLDYGVALVEDLRRKREPLPHLAAVYFISPGGESAAQVAADFGGCVESVADAASSNPPKGGSGGGDGESDDGSGKKKKRFGGLFGRAKRDKTPPASPKQPSQQRPQPPLYASAHVFFSSPPTTRDLELLRSCPGLVSPASNRLKSCADAGMEWLAVDGRCFVTQHPPAALAPLFGPAGADGEAPGARAAVALAGRRLATLFVSAGEHPVVRFRAPPPPAPGRSLGSRALLPQRLALEVHAALAAAAAAGAVPATPGGGAGGGRRGAAPRPSLPPPELVIVDRGADTFSVLCQAWGYEAMAADVLGVGAVSPGSSSAGGPGGGGAEATAGAAPATARTSTAGDAADASASASPAPLAPPPAPVLPWSSSTYRGTGPAVFEYETESGGSAAAGGAAAPLKSTRAARLDPETDPVFAALRDRHFAFASADVAARLDAFKAAHPESRDPSSANGGGGGGGGGGGSSLDTRAMRSLAARLPQYRDELSRLAAHVELASRLARAVDARRLLDAGALEQAFGSGKGGSRQLIAALSSSSGSSASTSASNSNPLPPPPPPFPQDVKLRLLLCYAATHPGKLDAAKEMQWAKLARLSPPADLAKCLAGLEALGVPVYKRGGSGSSSASSSSSNQGIPPLLLPGASAAMSAAAAKVLSRGASGVGGGGGGTFGSRVFGGGGGSLLSSPSTAATLAAGDASSASSSASDADYLTGAVPTLVAGIFDALAAGVLDRDTFPYVVPPPEEGGDGGAPAAPAPQQAAAPSLFGGGGSAGGSLAAAGRSRSVRSSHSTAAAWASRAPGGGAGGGSFNAGGLGLGGGGGNGGNVSSASASSPTPSGRRVVVFIVGGVSRGEARAATAAASRTGLRCVVGGTGLLSGPWFVQALRELGSLDYSHEVE